MLYIHSCRVWYQSDVRYPSSLLVFSISAPNEKLAVRVTITPSYASIYHLKDCCFTLYHSCCFLFSVCYYLPQSGDFKVWQMFVCF